MKLLLFIIAFGLIPLTVSAHGTDVSYLDVFITKDFQNNLVSNNEISSVLYLPWTEAAYIVEKSHGKLSLASTISIDTSSASAMLSPKERGLSQDNIASLTKYHDAYAIYIRQQLQVYNSDQLCTANFDKLPETEVNEILFGRGVPIPIKFKCEKPNKDLRFVSNLFFEEFPMQTNIINIYREPGKIIKGGLLTSSSRDVSLNMDSASSTTTNQFGAFDFKSLFSKNHSLWYLMSGVFLMGLLHTLEAGHSKTILASFMLNKEAQLKDGLLFIGVFTLTHIADILIMGALLLAINSFVNVFSKLAYLQTFSLYSIFFISLYLLLKNISDLIKHRFYHHLDHDHHHHVEESWDLKKQLLLGFVSGIAPCLVGWSVFMMILSTKNIWALFPIIMTFALGIATALSVVMLLVYNTKSRVFNRFEQLCEYSPLITALIMLSYSVVVLFR